VVCRVIISTLLIWPIPGITPSQGILYSHCPCDGSALSSVRSGCGSVARTSSSGLAIGHHYCLHYCHLSLYLRASAQHCRCRSSSRDPGAGTKLSLIHWSNENVVWEQPWKVSRKTNSIWCEDELLLLVKIREYPSLTIALEHQSTSTLLVFFWEQPLSINNYIFKLLPYFAQLTIFRTVKFCTSTISKLWWQVDLPHRH
jgi:hypothetical protein